MHDLLLCRMLELKSNFKVKMKINNHELSLLIKLLLKMLFYSYVLCVHKMMTLKIISKLMGFGLG
jgi:hypothetical protein